MKKWQTISSEVIHRNKYMVLINNRIIRPDGSLSDYFVLERDPFSIIIPTNNSNETYIVGQYRYAIGKYSWEFPMGSVSGKSPISTAKIELKQETGLEAKKFIKIGQFYNAPGHTNQLVTVFVATQLSIGKSFPEPGEFIKIKKIQIKELQKLIDSGKIKDGPTICAFYLFNVYLKQKLI